MRSSRCSTPCSRATTARWAPSTPRPSAGVFKKLALYAAQSPERLDAATTNLLVAEAVHLVVHLGFTEDP